MVSDGYVELFCEKKVHFDQQARNRSCRCHHRSQTTQFPMEIQMILTLFFENFGSVALKESIFKYVPSKDSVLDIYH
jgi:hypothetical protein